MENRSDVKEALTPKEVEELRKLIKENRHSPAKIGYILLEEKPLHPGLLLWLLDLEYFDDVGKVLVFLGGMPEIAVRLLLEHMEYPENKKWDVGRIDRAITKAKNYYYYSRFEFYYSKVGK